MRRVIRNGAGPARAGRARLARSARALALVLLAGLVTIAAASTSSAASGAHSASSLKVKDEGNLRFVKSSGSTLIDEGPVKGTIPGKVRVRFAYNGDPNVSAQLTIYGHGGTLEVRASARLSSPTNPKPSFSGNLTVSGGTGRYAHARGSGHLYGVYYRRSYGMLVQTEGHIQY